MKHFNPWKVTEVPSAFKGLLGAAITIGIGWAATAAWEKRHRIFGKKAGFLATMSPQKQSAYVSSLFALTGHMIKISGHMDEQHIAICGQWFEDWKLNEDLRTLAIASFNQGKQTDFPLEVHLTRLKWTCENTPFAAKQALLSIFEAAAITQPLLARQWMLLNKIAVGLGLTTADVKNMSSRFFDRNRDKTGSLSSGNLDFRVLEAYHLLGVEEHASVKDVRLAYRRMLSQHHPDKLIAQGGNGDTIRQASKKICEIRTAYDLICRARGV